MRSNRQPCWLRLSLCFPHSWQCLVVAMILLALPARAQQTAETDAASQLSTQAPVPLSDVLTESESVSESIRDIRTDLTADRSAALIAGRLTPLTREIDTRLRETRKILAQHPSVEILGSLDGEWRRLRREISGINRSLSGRVHELDRQIGQIDDLAKTWEQTFTAASQSSAPTEVLDR